MIYNQFAPPAELIRAINRHGFFVLATHFNPDADALGSLLGLQSILEKLGKKTLAWTEEPVNHLYRFFPDADKTVSDVARLEAFCAATQGDCALVALDCGDRKRLGREMDRLLAIRPALVIDHHLGHREFGDLSWIVAHRSSTGEMVHDLAKELLPSLPPEACFSLFAAICADTGSFRYECASAHTFRVAADLVESGVRPDIVTSHLFDNFSPARLRLLQQVLASLELHMDERVAVACVTQKMLDVTGSSMEDTDGFINYLRALQQVQVAIFLKETNGVLSVSLRAKGRCNVADVALAFGGGGHRNAAGFRYPGHDMAGLKQKLLATLAPCLEKNATSDGCGIH